MKRILILSLVVFVSLMGCDKIKALKGGADQQAAANQKSADTSAKTAVAIEDSKPEAASAADSSDVLAKVDGQPITDHQVSGRVESQLKKLESQIFDIKRSGLNSVIEEVILEKEAKKRSISIDELLKAEVDSKVQDPSEEEIQTFYQMYKDRLNGQPLEKVKARLVQQIKGTKQSSVYDTYINKLKKDAKIEVLMERPRITVSVDDDPSQGVKDAPIILIEFSDFQCPFCKRTRPTITQIMEEYKGKVNYVFRDFPLSFHKQAPKAAQAANCAGDQEKYWEYNTTLWENQGSIAENNLVEYAKKLGLNEKNFKECLDSDKYADEIAKDFQEGSIAGVSGTPAYFINGIFLSGARPFEAFKEVIDEELQRLGKN